MTPTGIDGSKYAARAVHCAEKTAGQHRHGALRGGGLWRPRWRARRVVDSVDAGRIVVRVNDDETEAGAGVDIYNLTKVHPIQSE